jgi:type III restriction enzyme
LNRRTLVFKNGLWPLGLLAFCIDYSKTKKHSVGGVFESIRQGFSKFNETDLYDTVKIITDFRNTYIAHQEKELTDIELAKEGLKAWTAGINRLYFVHH